MALQACLQTTRCKNISHPHQPGINDVDAVIPMEETMCRICSAALDVNEQSAVLDVNEQCHIVFGY